MNLSKILADVEIGLKGIEAIAPVAASIGVPFAGTIASAAGALSDVLTNVQARVADGTVVATSTDIAQIDAIAARLDPINEALNQYVEQS